MLNTRRHTVLIVDDQDGIRESLTELITFRTQLPVRAVADANSAFEVLEQTEATIGAILLDDHLGEGASGFQILPQLRSKFPRVPIIFMGSNATLRGEGEYRPFAIQVLPKPWDSATLVQAILRAMALARFNPN